MLRKIKYEINGRIHTFIVHKSDGDAPFGHSKGLFAWLYDDHIVTVDKQIILGRRLN